MPNFPDNELYITDSVDITKQMRFKVGTIPPSTIFTAQLPVVSAGVPLTMPFLELSQIWTDQQGFDDTSTTAVPIIVRLGNHAVNTEFLQVQDSVNGSVLSLFIPGAGLTVGREQVFQNAGGTIALIGSASAPTPVGVGTGTNPPASGFVGRVDLIPGQGANIASTKLTDACAAGMYRITTYLETTGIGIGSTIVTIAWTDDVGATTDSTTALVLTAPGRVSKTINSYLASGDISYSSAGYVSGAFALRIRCEMLG